MSKDVTVIETPIIVDDFGDLLFFDSVERVELYVEPVDIRDNEHVAYDGKGRLLVLDIREQEETGKGLFRFVSYVKECVVLRLEEAEPTHEGELYNKLVVFFSKVGEPEDWLSRASLKELVTRGLERYATK